MAKGASQIQGSQIGTYAPLHKTIRSWLSFTLLPAHGNMFSCHLHTTLYRPFDMHRVCDCAQCTYTICVVPLLISIQYAPLRYAITRLLSSLTKTYIWYCCPMFAFVIAWYLDFNGYHIYAAWKIHHHSFGRSSIEETLNHALMIHRRKMGQSMYLIGYTIPNHCITTHE